MRAMMISAMNSGSGKTVLTCGLLAALKAREMDVQAFKCGPDYIDPMFHSRVLTTPSRHLGLLTAREVENLSARFGAIARQMERTVNLSALLALAGECPACAAPPPFPPAPLYHRRGPGRGLLLLL